MTATVVAFRPNAASAEKPRKQPGVLTLKALPGAGKSMDFEGGHFMGTLTVGEHAVMADDGHLLGLAAFVMGASSVKVHMPSFKGDEPLRLRSNAHFHSVKVETLSYDKAGRKRHEAWFIKRFGSGFYTGSNGARAQLGLIEHWEKNSLPKVLALVPGEAQLFTRFARAAAYDDQGHPLSAGAIAREAHDKRVMDAFRAAAEAPPEPSVDWNHVVRAEDPHGPVAINGPAWQQVKRLQNKYHFPRMPDSWAELVALESFDLSIGSALMPLLGSSKPNPSWVENYLKVHAHGHARSHRLFEACVRQDEGVVKVLQAEQDWLVVLAGYYSAEANEILSDDTIEDDAA